MQFLGELHGVLAFLDAPLTAVHNFVELISGVMCVVRLAQYAHTDFEEGSTGLGLVVSQYGELLDRAGDGAAGAGYDLCASIDKVRNLGIGLRKPRTIVAVARILQVRYHARTSRTWCRGRNRWSASGR